MSITKQPSTPLNSLFVGSEAAVIIDYLLSTENHRTAAEIRKDTGAAIGAINRTIDDLLDIDAAGVGAKKIQDPGSATEGKEVNTYFIRNDTDTGRSIRDLWYHLMQVQTKNFS